jgi:ParB family chromosome partitioning protein
MAEKIGFDVTYIDGIILLLRKGEEKLIAQVEAGTLPLSVAMKIASASNQEVQRALTEAYDKGDLRGEKLRAVQRLITQRFAKDHSAGSKPERKVTGKDLVREYERHVQPQKTLLRRASVISQRPALLTSTLKRLRSDEHFVTLLRAESLEKLTEERFQSASHKKECYVHFGEACVWFRSRRIRDRPSDTTEGD